MTICYLTVKIINKVYKSLMGTWQIDTANGNLLKKKKKSTDAFKNYCKKNN